VTTPTDTGILGSAFEQYRLKLAERGMDLASKRIRNMSEEESLSVFVNAGILTPKGNVRKRFKKVIVH